MRSRPHVIIARLNDEEMRIYERILNKAIQEHGYPRNKSEAFRLVLKAISERVGEENRRAFYEDLDV